MPSAPSFVSYEAAISDALESAFQAGHLSFNGAIGDRKYQIEFCPQAPDQPPLWTQTLAASPHRWRRVRRFSPAEHQSWRDFGRTMPRSAPHGEEGVRRQQVLHETLEVLQRESASRTFHRHAQANLERWRAAARGHSGGSCCEVRVLPGDWGEVSFRFAAQCARVSRIVLLLVFREGEWLSAD